MLSTLTAGLSWRVKKGTITSSARTLSVKMRVRSPVFKSRVKVLSSGDTESLLNVLAMMPSEVVTSTSGFPEVSLIVVVRAAR